MKHVKTFENVDYDSVKLGDMIEDICFQWQGKLNLQEPIDNPNKKRIYMKLYHELNSYTYPDFNEFVQTLDELKTYWNYTDGRNFTLDYSKCNPDDIELYWNSKKYNL